MKVLTYSTEIDQFCLNILKRKLNVEILPELLPWKDSQEGLYYHDFYPRIYSLGMYLNNVDPEELIIMTDAYDVLPLNNCSLQNLENKIQKCFDLKKITFCAETNCFPEEALADQYPFHSSPWKYLNAGIFTGKCKVLKQLIQKTLPKIKGSMDQLEFSKFFLIGNLINLDHECQVFQSVFDANTERRVNWDFFEIENKQIKNKIFDSFPLLFHGNGGVDMSCFYDYI